MGDYKQINRELMDSNIELKQLVATLQKELVLMRADLMEQHRLRVEAEYNCRDRILSMLAKNFVTSIYEIGPDINIMELLGYRDCIQNSNAGPVGLSEQSSGSVRSNRRSTQLVRDFRRSSIACRQQSVVQMSPTRRLQEDDPAAIEEETESDDEKAESCSDMELDESINVIDVENDDTAKNDTLDCIHEEGNEEREEEIETEIREREKAYHLRKQYPLRDLSNDIIAHKAANKEKIIKRGKQQESLSGCENSIEVARENALDGVQRPTQFELDMEIENDLANSMHCSLHLTPDRATKASVEKQHENTACKEKSRKHLVVRLQRCQAPTPEIIVHTATESKKWGIPDTIISQASANISDITRKHDATAFSLGCTEYSLGNFLEAHCSTPCSKETAKEREIKQAETGAVTVTRSEGAVTTPLFDSTLKQSMRPSRKCTPTTLAEPSLRDKLRNETGKGTTRSRKMK